MRPSPGLNIHRQFLQASPASGEGLPAPDPTAALPDPRDADAAGRCRRVYFEVFGCQMNKLDAELMVGVLLENGYEITDRIEAAGVVLFVSCSVRQQAENRVFSKIGQLKARKQSDEDFVVGLMGCMAQNQPEEIRRRFPYLDLICGTAEFLRLPELITEARASKKPLLAVDIKADLKFARTKNLGAKPFQAFVSVMRGCDQACTFCIVPKTRGKEISRPIVEIVDEVRALVDDGVKEVTLLGQTVNSYGKRLAPGRRIGFHHLLHQLDKIRGLERLRFITSHPRFMTPDLIDALADLESVCEYLHLPIQSGSDAVLKRMLRTYTVDRYRDTIARCRERIQGFALATDFIVGFPGETDAEFETSCDILEEMQYQNSFVFKYSPRPGTRADDFPDDVPDAVKQERNQRLLAIQKRVSERMYEASIGTLQEVLVEGPSKNDSAKFASRNRAHQIVIFPGASRSDLVGQLVQVRITSATNLTLFGELASSGVPDGTLASASRRDGGVPVQLESFARGDV